MLIILSVQFLYEYCNHVSFKDKVKKIHSKKVHTKYNSIKLKFCVRLLLAIIPRHGFLEASILMKR